MHQRIHTPLKLYLSSIYIIMMTLVVTCAAKHNHHEVTLTMEQVFLLPSHSTNLCPIHAGSYL